MHQYKTNKTVLSYCNTTQLSQGPPLNNKNTELHHNIDLVIPKKQLHINAVRLAFVDLHAQQIL